MHRTAAYRTEEDVKKIRREVVRTDFESQHTEKEFPENPADLVLFTRILDGAMKPPKMHMSLPLEPSHTRPQPVAAKPSTDLKGLCVNCAQNTDCIFAQADSGVWQCEMYE